MSFNEQAPTPKIDLTEAVDAAAREFHATRRGNTVPWDSLARTTQDYYRLQARIHLRAAAPYVIAAFTAARIEEGRNR